MIGESCAKFDLSKMCVHDGEVGGDGGHADKVEKHQAQARYDENQQGEPWGLETLKARLDARHRTGYQSLANYEHYSPTEDEESLSNVKEQILVPRGVGYPDNTDATNHP